jgi:hypothetical protein
MNGVFVTEAPVLQKDADFYTSADIFPALKNTHLKSFIK